MRISGSRSATALGGSALRVALACSLLIACGKAAPARRCAIAERPLDLFVELTEAFPRLPAFEQPVGLYQNPSDPSRMFVLEKGGLLKGFRVDEPSSDPWVVADLRERVNTNKECGLLGMAFHPNFADDPRVWLSYCTGDDPTRLRYAGYRYDSTRHTIDLGSETVVLEIETPRRFHHGGQLRFDRSGWLVTGVGDTGPHGDPDGHAQNARDLPGSFLRIDVLAGKAGAGYAIPGDNPFAPTGKRAGQGAPEVYAYGFRNPWSWSFDRETGAIWAGDVGFNGVEEVDRVEPGSNYGWPALEGDRCDEDDCANRGFVAPIATFENTGNTAVIGGYVYRGEAISELRGVYLFADFGGGALYGVFDPYGSHPESRLIFPASGINPSAFHEDADGELYLTDIGKGRIFKLAPSRHRAAGAFPATLSETGCVAFAEDGKPTLAGGAADYDVRMPLWSDRADKLRALNVPEGRATLEASGDLQFPIGSVFLKLFQRDGALIEGRLLVRHADGAWGGYSYEWKAELGDGILLEDGKTVRVGDGSWTFPSREDCFACHSAAAGFVLGAEAAQLGAHGLDALRDRGVLDGDRYARDPASTLARRADDESGAAADEHWVRSYLHANCSGCHRPGGPSDADIDLRYVVAEDGTTLPLSDMHVCDATPTVDDLGLRDPAIVRPGAPQASVLYLRMADLGELRMPPLASAIPDELALERVERWIETLDACP
jgi:glucose/arabinose dehydrogenase